MTFANVFEHVEIKIRRVRCRNRLAWTERAGHVARTLGLSGLSVWVLESVDVHIDGMAVAHGVLSLGCLRLAYTCKWLYERSD